MLLVCFCVRMVSRVAHFIHLARGTPQVSHFKLSDAGIASVEYADKHGLLIVASLDCIVVLCTLEGCLIGRFGTSELWQISDKSTWKVSWRMCAGLRCNSVIQLLRAFLSLTKCCLTKSLTLLTKILHQKGLLPTMNHRGYCKLSLPFPADHASSIGRRP